MSALKTISRWIAGAALAGAIFVAAPQKSEAQVAVGVQIGGPVVVARPVPPPYYRPYYGGYYRPYGYRPYGYYGPRPVYYAPRPVYVRPVPPPYYYRPGVSFGVRVR